MPCFPFASFRNVTPARVSKWPSVCKSHRVKLTGIRAQPESSSSIRSMMCSAPKRSLNTVGYTLSSGGFSSELHPQWCESQAATCHGADPARYTLCVWSLLSRPEGDRRGWLTEDARLCLNVSAFFGGGTLSLAQQQQIYQKLQEIRASLYLLHLKASENVWMSYYRHCW